MALGSFAATLPAALSREGAGVAEALVVEKGAPVVDALRSPGVTLDTSDPGVADPRRAIDGSEETAWVGAEQAARWTWSAGFATPTHIGLLRAQFNESVTSGVPTALHWEFLPPRSGDSACEPARGAGDEGWSTVAGTDQTDSQAWSLAAQPPRRSWFVDVDACGLRLVVDRTNGGPPVLREAHAIEGARDILRDAAASDDSPLPGTRPADAIDGTYARRWAGTAGRGRWVLRVDLSETQPVNRVRLVLGFDSISSPRPGGGRSYAVAWSPVRYTLEASEDGDRFTAIATEPLRPDGTVVPLRRRLITIPSRAVRALRLVMDGATGEDGLPDPRAAPVVREIAAYRSDDRHPVLAAPWILSVNANPSAQSHGTPGGEWANDAYHTRFLYGRFTPLLPALRADDRFARMTGPYGDPAVDASGEALESIEGDDPALDAQLLGQSSPPPIVVLSGSNDWDYAPVTGPDPARPARWLWDPLRDAASGGMGQLKPAVAHRVAPFLGFCGGAQILTLLEAGRLTGASPDEDARLIDLVLKRTSGHPIRGFAPPVDVERAWPGDSRARREKVSFRPDDPLFADLAGPTHRSTTLALPESHSDAIRADAFRAGGPLQRFDLLATSAFCASDVVAAGPRDTIFPNPSGAGWCGTVPEAFRSRDPAWPVIGAQFHPEQRDFFTPAAGDPAESVADPRLFLVGAYEQIVDAYERLGP